MAHHWRAPWLAGSKRQPTTALVVSTPDHDGDPCLSRGLRDPPSRRVVTPGHILDLGAIRKPEPLIVAGPTSESNSTLNYLLVV